MILADKITNLRKKEGWSQEEFAERMGVSRQSISKWEGGRSTPDMNKILQMSELFGVSTDVLLKDDLTLEDEVTTTAASSVQNDNGEALYPVSLELANEYMDQKASAAVKIAFGVMLCIMSPILLIFLDGANEAYTMSFTTNQAMMSGLTALILMVGVAVALFIVNGIRLKKYEPLEKEPLDTAYDVDGVVKEKQAGFERAHTRDMTVGIVMCVLSCLPIFIALILNKRAEFGVCLLLFIVAIGVFLIVRTSIIWGSYNVLLEQGDYTRPKKAVEKRIGGIYWGIVMAAYLLISFVTFRWESTWIIWPVAGVLYSVVGMALAKK